MNQSTSNSKLNIKTVALSFLYLVACVFIPLITSIDLGEWLPDAISLTLAIVSVVAFSKITKGFKYVFPYAAILCISAFLGGGFILAGLIASIACTVCLFAYLCFKSSIYVTVAIPAIAYIPALAITGDPIAATIVFFSLPAAMLTVYVIKSKKPKVSAICHMCIGFCLSLAAMLAIAIYKSSGSIAPDSIAAFFESAKIAVTAMLKEGFAVLGESASDIVDISAFGLDFDTIIENVVTVAFNLLPAIAVIIFNALSYLLHSITLTLLFATDENKDAARPMLLFDMSIHSAFIFLVALVLSFALVSPNTAMYGAVAENLAVILIPGYVMTALAALRAFATQRAPSCLGALLYFFVIFMIASLSYPIIIATAVGGAILKIVFFFKGISKKKT